MRNFRLVLLLIISLIILIACQTLSYSQVASFPWSNNNGIPYHKSFDRCTGFEAFIPVQHKKIAFLLKEESVIRIFASEKKLKHQDIAINAPAYDFDYHKQKFFLLSPGAVEIIDLSKGTRQLIPMKTSPVFFSKIKVVGGKIFLFTNNQETYELQPETAKIQKVPDQGMIMQEGVSLRSVKNSENSFSISINNHTKTYNTTQKLASAQIAGYLGSCIFVDVQYIVHEVPLKVAREIWSIKTGKNGIIREPVIRKVPNCYYILAASDISITPTKAYYALTDPEGVKIFNLNANTEITTKKEFLDIHFSSNTMPAPELQDIGHAVKAEDSISRPEIIANAEPFATHAWYCNAGNIYDNVSCGGTTINTPSWITTGPKTSIPYCWGGWTSLTVFDAELLNNKSAGDDATSYSSSSPQCAVGVDCSGFVSRVWELSYKRGTSTLPNVSTAYASFSQLLPGDLINYAGSHARLFHSWNLSGTMHIIESSASGTNWRVGYNDYTAAQLQANYIPRYYNYIINSVPAPQDTTPPQTSITAGTWHTGNFNVSFTDTDASGIQERYWLPASLNNNNWHASTADGFLYEDYTDTVNVIWTTIEPSWNIISGALCQTNQALTQNNAYTFLKQDSNNSYLFSWKMKVSGTSSDRRGGIYFFSDSGAMLQRNNAYMVYYRADYDKCQIYKSVNNAITLMTDDEAVIDENGWFDCDVTYQPASGLISAYLNKELVSSWVDPAPLTSGRYVSLRTGACQGYFDEIRAYKSRANSSLVTVGPGKMIPDQNPNPSTPACRIHSVVIDSANNMFSTFSATNIDYTPPTPVPAVADYHPGDADTTSEASNLNAYWNPATDSNSGISQYFYALGTTPGACDVIPFTPLNDTFAVCNNLNLQNFQMYYFSVKAKNMAGLESDFTTSDGIFTDILYTSAGTPADRPFQLFPNPAGNYLNIYGTDPGTKLQFRLTDAIGRTVISMPLQSKNQHQINLSDISEGIYFYCITDGTQQMDKGNLLIIR